MITLTVVLLLFAVIRAAIDDLCRDRTIGIAIVTVLAILAILVWRAS